MATATTKATYGQSGITYTEGRAYQKGIYSLAYELRRFLKPSAEQEGLFKYADLHTAELMLMAWAYGDDKLLEDIESGRFVDYWLARYPMLTKEQLKANAYAIAYSGKGDDLAYGTPDSFFADFAETYSAWFAAIQDIVRASEKPTDDFVASYRNWITGRTVEFPSAEDKNFTYKVLNHRVQQSLSSYAQILYAELVKSYGQDARVYCLNFDSILMTTSDTLSDWEARLAEIQARLVDEGVLPIAIPFAVSEGSTFAEAQGK